MVNGKNDFYGFIDHDAQGGTGRNFIENTQIIEGDVRYDRNLNKFFNGYFREISESSVTEGYGNLDLGLSYNYQIKFDNPQKHFKGYNFFGIYLGELKYDNYRKLLSDLEGLWIVKVILPDNRVRYLKQFIDPA